MEAVFIASGTHGLESASNVAGIHETDEASWPAVVMTLTTTPASPTDTPAATSA